MDSTICSTNTFEGHLVLETADPKNPNSLVISHHSHVETQLFKRAAAPALCLACSAVSTLASCHVHHGPCHHGPVHALLWLSQPIFPLSDWFTADCLSGPLPTSAGSSCASPGDLATIVCASVSTMILLKFLSPTQLQGPARLISPAPVPQSGPHKE